MYRLSMRDKCMRRVVHIHVMRCKFTSGYYNIIFELPPLNNNFVDVDKLVNIYPPTLDEKNIMLHEKYRYGIDALREYNEIRNEGKCYKCGNVKNCKDMLTEEDWNCP